MQNLVLIGMPGAGKSTIGVLAAKALGMSFVDTDLLIQQKEHRLLQDIINQDGIEKFLKTEEDVILSMKAENCVIATGGSVVYSHCSIRHLKNSGFLVYLQLPYAEVKERINNMAVRGIVISKGQTLIDLYSERSGLYEAFADVTVNCSGKSIEDAVRSVCDTAAKNLRPLNYPK